MIELEPWVSLTLRVLEYRAADPLTDRFTGKSIGMVPSLSVTAQFGTSPDPSKSRSCLIFW